MKEFKGKTAFISGGASGIGRAMAHAFAEEGMNVVVGDIEEIALRETELALKVAGAKVLAVPLDVTNRESYARAAEATYETFGDVHVLCNNAGVSVGMPIQETQFEDWDWVLGVNLNGVINGILTFLPQMLEHKDSGHVVNTASIAGHIAPGDMGPYCASKFAVVGLSESLEQDLEDSPIGVSVLCPAYVNTRIVDSERNRPGGEPIDPELKEGLIELLGATGILEPEDIAQTVLTAMREEELYILTHPMIRPAVEARYANMMKSWDRWQARMGKE